MLLRHLFATLLLAVGSPVHAGANGTEAGPPGFLSSTDCFQATPDYESWLQSIPDTIDGMEIPREALAKAVPARAFAFARSGFDCRIVTYASDGQVVSGYVVQPKTAAAGGKHPLLVYNRGGNGDFGRIDSLQLFRKLLPLAKAGYVVVASQYRDDDEFGGKDVDDVMRLIDLSLPLPGVDAEHVFMMGESRGAMTAELVARQRPDITAMATIGGCTDLVADLAWRPEMERVYRARIPGYDGHEPAALEARSALRWAEQLPAGMPVLLMHGELDERVNVENSRAMAARLEALGRPHKLVVYAGDDHGVRQHRRDAMIEMLAWFKGARSVNQAGLP
jgi:dipeptidyl aminopeptidase/acylaminoacyl peptidase